MNDDPGSEWQPSAAIVAKPETPPPARPTKPAFGVNLFYCVAYVLELAFLVFPPLGILILLVAYRKHKAYLKSFPNSGYN